MYHSTQGIEEMSKEPERWAERVGYIWILVFLIWSSRVWMYPSLRVSKGEDKGILLLYSFIKLRKDKREVKI